MQELIALLSSRLLMIVVLAVYLMRSIRRHYRNERVLE